jgi:WD40 repeat protein
VAVSHEGALVAAAGRQEAIRIWSGPSLDAPAATSEPPWKLAGGHTEWIQSLAFAPSDHRLASGGKDKVICIWNPDHSIPARTLLGHRGRVWSVAWSPDSQRLASAGADGARVWSLAEGADTPYPHSNHPHHSLDIYPDGSRLLTGSSHDGIVRFWDPAQNARATWFQAHWAGEPFVARISPDQRLIATRQAGETRIYRSTSPFELVGKLTGGKSDVDLLAWSPAGYLATATSENTVLLVDPATLRVVQRFEHDSTVWDLAFTHDGRYLATASQALTVWDVATGKVAFSLPESHRRIAAARDRPLVVAGAGSNVTLLDLAADPPRVATLVTSGAEVQRLALDGPTLAVAFYPAADISLWDTRTHQLLAELACNASHISGLAFSPDGRRLICVGSRRGGVGNGVIWQWKIEK